MYRAFVRRVVKATFRHLSAGEHDEVLRSFAPSAQFCFAGDHALGGQVHGIDRIRAWFERLGRLFPGIQLGPVDVCVGGWPWNTVVSTHFTAAATLPDGRPYENEGMQLLRIRWGRVVEDRIFEDTQAVVSALDVIARCGNAEAGVAPLGRVGRDRRPAIPDLT